MEKFRILKVDGYRDGGTVSIQTNQGDYCIDGRALSKNAVNPTEGMLFLGYPKDNEPLSLEESKKIKSQIKSALKSFTGQVHESYLSKIKNIRLKDDELKPMNNSKGLKVGDIVQHDDGNIGRVFEVEYNDADECEVEWWGKMNGIKASRTTIKYLTLITVVM